MGPADVTKNIAEGSLPTTRTALAELVAIALTVGNVEQFTGRGAPTVIT
jgi:hypothetical protein